MLRAPRTADIANLMAVYDDDFNLVPTPRPKTDLALARHGILTRIEKNPHPFPGAWWRLDLIVESIDGESIGWTSVNRDDDLPGRQLESTTWVAPSFRRRGHAITIRRGLLALAFDGLDADVALSRAQPRNVASNRISDTLGYAQGQTTYTVRNRIAYTNWSLTREVWKQIARPNNIEVHGHEPFRDWLNLH